MSSLLEELRAVATLARRRGPLGRGAYLDAQTWLLRLSDAALLIPLDDFVDAFETALVGVRRENPELALRAAASVERLSEIVQATKVLRDVALKHLDQHIAELEAKERGGS